MHSLSSHTNSLDLSHYSHASCLLPYSHPIQIFLSFPIMLLLVTVLFGQHQLSALTLCTLFVAAGVSADNLFVVHETWRTSSLITINGHPADLQSRVWWTVRMAGHPLLVADLTTAFALYINCLSPITGIYQFGLCGGTQSTYYTLHHHPPHPPPTPLFTLSPLPSPLSNTQIHRNPHPPKLCPRPLLHARFISIRGPRPPTHLAMPLPTSHPIITTVTTSPPLHHHHLGLDAPSIVEGQMANYHPLHLPYRYTHPICPRCHLHALLLPYSIRQDTKRDGLLPST